MATSRTGTNEWKKLRARELRKAQRLGQVHCPWCGVTLDYQQGRTPSSAELDHVEPYSATQSNLGKTRVICRRCNQSKGNRSRPKIATIQAARPLKTSRRW
ncbi:MAG: HNH endonuclease domain-containing protein [Galactobacter sp.]